ncbi:MAG: hypothetical protein ACFBSC_08345 [Microcoleaceae cyanobacterium]
MTRFVKFSDLDQRRQILIAGHALGMRNIRLAFSTFPRVVRTVFKTSAGQAQRLTPQELADLIQQLDESAESENPKLFLDL